MGDVKKHLTSSHWGSYEAVTEDGKLCEMIPFKRDGDPSPIGQGIIGTLDHAARIGSPMIRKGWLDDRRANRTSSGEGRGEEAFVAVDWAEAAALAGDELDRVTRSHGNEAIFAGSYGWASAGRFHHAQSQIHRFLNTIGGYTKSVNTYSFAAAEIIFPHVLGDFRKFLYKQTSWPSIIGNSELFVAFGGIAIKNAQIGQGGIGEHRQRQWMREAHANGVEFVNVSPVRNDAIKEINAEWLAIRPNTDSAMMLAMCHVLLEEELHDQAFLDSHTNGFDRVAAYIRGESDGQPKTPEWAEGICGIPSESIRKLARRMAAKRTMISLSWSLSRQAYGEQPLWAGVTLAAFLGQIGLPGGGFGFGYSAVQSVGNITGNYNVMALPQGENGVSTYIPVARVTDMLLNPGGGFQFNGHDLTYPDIRLVYWAGGNPFHHHQDLNRLRKAWRRPETVIVHDWCWNALAKHADIVLPCTTTLERDDIAMSPIDNYIISMEKAVEPFGESRSDYDILTAISRHMGVEAKFTEGRSSEGWQRHIYEQTVQLMAGDGHALPDYDEFRRKKWIELETESRPKVLFEDFRRDPAAHPLNTPSGRIELYSETIEGFGYTDVPPMASWIEPPEWLGGAGDTYPLHLICNQPRTKLHSQMDHGGVSRRAKVNGHEAATLHPEDAAARGVAEGDILRVFNDRGSCICGAVISDAIMPGVVLIPTGAWYDPGEGDVSCKHGNPNVLTSDRGTSRLAQGPAAHSCLVQVEKWGGGRIVVTAFDPPEILPDDGRA